jgi:hypothetical protein
MVERTGIYMLYCEARMVNLRNNKTIVNFQLNDSIIASKAIDTATSCFRVPIRAALGDSIMVFVTAPEGNECCTTLFSLSIQPMFYLN